MDNNNNNTRMERLSEIESHYKNMLEAQNEAMILREQELVAVASKDQEAIHALKTALRRKKDETEQIQVNFQTELSHLKNDLEDKKVALATSMAHEVREAKARLEDAAQTEFRRKISDLKKVHKQEVKELNEIIRKLREKLREKNIEENAANHRFQIRTSKIRSCVFTISVYTGQHNAVINSYNSFCCI